MRELKPSEENRGFDRASLVKQLFEEWNVSRQCATGAGGHYIPEYAAGPGGGFYANELGFGWRNSGRDVLQTSRSLRSLNDSSKQQLKKAHEEQQRKLKADAAREGKRPVLEPWREAEGCTGCLSCVPGARVAPRTIRLAGLFSDWQPDWMPGTVPRAIREHRAVISFLRTAAAAVRRAHAAQRSAAYRERKERNAAARATMQARRAEEKTMQRAARRALGTASTTRR